MILPSFSNFLNLVEVQGEVLCDEIDRARKVTSITVCGAWHGKDADEESLKRSAELVSCMIYKDLLKQVDIHSRSAEHDHTLSMDLIEESRLQGLGAFLNVEKGWRRQDPR